MFNTIGSIHGKDQGNSPIWPELLVEEHPMDETLRHAEELVILV